MKRGSHSPPASAPAPHQVAVRDVTVQGWPARSPLMLPLPNTPVWSPSDSTITVKVAKRGQKAKKPEESGRSGRRKTFQGDDSKGLAAVGSDFHEKVWHLLF